MVSHPPSIDSSMHSVRIAAYFDFMCPWSYLGRARLLRAIKRANIHADIYWVPFELYSHDENHRVTKEKILGHSNLNEVYAQLHPLGLRENIEIFHPKYEASSKRALIGFLYAQHEKKEKEYMDEIFEHAFHHTMDISSFAVLRRIALKLHFDVEKFLVFIQDEKNHARVEELTHTAKLNGVRGVPTYLINHLPVTGALTVDDLVKILHSVQRKIIPAFILSEPAKKHSTRHVNKPRPRKKILIKKTKTRASSHEKRAKSPSKKTKTRSKRR